MPVPVVVVVAPPVPVVVVVVVAVVVVVDPPLPLPPSGIDATHWLPEHTWLAPQVPQLTTPPQPSGAAPQLSPAGQVVAGTQPPVHTLARQVAVPVQVPQLTMPEQPSK